jgi:hypothetical protein
MQEWIDIYRRMKTETNNTGSRITITKDAPVCHDRRVKMAGGAFMFLCERADDDAAPRSAGFAEAPVRFDQKEHETKRDER